MGASERPSTRVSAGWTSANDAEIVTEQKLNRQGVRNAALFTDPAATVLISNAIHRKDQQRVNWT